MTVKPVQFSNVQVHGVDGQNEGKKGTQIPYKGAYYGNPPMTSSAKAGIFFTSVLGVLGALAIMAKTHKLSLSPKNLVETYKKLPIREGAVMAIAGGSVVGGLVGGTIFDDKKNFAAKLRETLNQIVGAVGVPLAFVSAASHLFTKGFGGVKDDGTAVKPYFEKAGQFFEKTKGAKGAAKVVVAMAALIAGTFAGNKVSNAINEKVCNKKVDRGVKVTDLAAHVDDIGIAATLMSEKGSKWGHIISRFVPLALIIPGYEVGVTQEGRYDKKG